MILVQIPSLNNLRKSTKKYLRCPQHLTYYKFGKTNGNGDIGWILRQLDKNHRKYRAFLWHFFDICFHGITTLTDLNLRSQQVF